MTALSTGPASPELTETINRIVYAFCPTKRVITPQLEIEADLGFNSLSLAELAFAMEDLFGLDPVVPEVAVSLRAVSDIEALVGSHLESGDARMPTSAEVDDYLARYSVS